MKKSVMEIGTLEDRAHVLGNFVGAELADEDGQIYEVVGLRPHRSRRGVETLLAEWRSNCATCGATYTFRRSALLFSLAPTRRCETHRDKGLSVVTERRRLGLGETAPVRRKRGRAKTPEEVERSKAFKIRVAESKRVKAQLAKAQAEKRAKRTAEKLVLARQQAEQEFAEAQRSAEIRRTVETARRERGVPVPEIRPLTVFD